jgi:hypothetical protein
VEAVGPKSALLHQIPCPAGPGNDEKRYHLASQHEPGSIVIFLGIGPAAGAVRNFTNAFAASGAGAAVCRPMVYTVMCWMSFSMTAG